MGKDINTFKKGEKALARITLESEKRMENAGIRVGFFDSYDRKIASGICVDVGTIEKGESEVTLEIDFAGLVAGTYRGELIFFTQNGVSGVTEQDIVIEGFWLDIDYPSVPIWNAFKWGSVRLRDIIKK